MLQDMLQKTRSAADQQTLDACSTVYQAASGLQIGRDRTAATHVALA
jgi:hypothetical protein